MIAENRTIHMQPGPYIDVTVNGKAVQCRLDTGADISTFPKDVLEERCNTLTIQFATGSRERVHTYKAVVEIEGKEFKIEALPTSSATGLIGMDILKDCLFYMVGGIWELAPV